MSVVACTCGQRFRVAQPGRYTCPTCRGPINVDGTGGERPLPTQKPWWPLAARAVVWSLCILWSLGWLAIWTLCQLGARTAIEMAATSAQAAAVLVGGYVLARAADALIGLTEGTRRTA